MTGAADSRQVERRTGHRAEQTTGCRTGHRARCRGPSRDPVRPRGAPPAGLPALVERLAVRRDPEVTGAVPQGSTSRAFRVGRADGSAAFLKPTPGPGICAAEALARGRHDAETALLLELAGQV
ncbi:hypothetical protein HS048_11200 [Planomonospora sp. ID91781]|uniref:hypothetical protein n=1 Tax=Planomonospora sp. ID91781 TaxID=2738135 RepID=UPI0018C43C5F|nr:hypothetical protein [Planomonospora sp. ID91781]MBG0821301.1 hypothetical protein [Planomonospora sp. ID91781]